MNDDARPDQPDDLAPPTEVEPLTGGFRRKNMWKVLLGAAIFVAAAGSLQLLMPYVLPPYIYEGPLVQMAGEDEVTLVWYMSRGVEAPPTITIEGVEPPPVVEVADRRCRCRVANLAAGESYQYTIKLDERTLHTAAFQTNRPAGEPFSFAIFGDSGKGTRAQFQLAARMAQRNPDLVLHTGDLIYSGGERYHYKERFFDAYAGMLQRVCFWPSIGNHDVGDDGEDSAYFEVFELPENGPPGVTPEHDYWFDYGSARIVVIDTEHDATTIATKVTPWLSEVLTDCAADWKFVVLHRPPYTAGPHNPCLAARESLCPIFEQTGVDIVFAGHDHMYERTYPMRAGEKTDDSTGVVYVVTGAGGASLYDALPLDQRPDYFAAINADIHSFTHVSIDGWRLTLEQESTNGDILDRWTLDRTPGATP